MVKRAFILLILCSMTTVLLIACGTPTVSKADNPVHMDNTVFLSSSITIKKGEHITLVSDTLISHTIANGTWENGSAKPAKESGAPTANNVLVGGNSIATIGPFTSAGSFKLYCIVHPGMNLTVIVQ
ncbi:MAG TPA: plastocyanin/azurin family copper-binding protein [Ktedonobacteraceae bacterium]|nr:plastocyanin/azurin family copper-binding protein [Ktedonobacteraceae bacterium]